MSIVYNTESYKDVKDEVADLAQANYDEGDPRNIHTGLDIDWSMYELMEDTGGALLVTARNSDALIGYLSLSLMAHPHIKNFIQASSDALYISPEYRGKSVASDMLRATEDALKEAGVSWLSLSFRDEKVSKGLMDRLEYNKTEVVFSKSLGDK